MRPMICLLLALLAGLASGFQGPANGALGRAWGLARAVALNGAVVCVGTLIGMMIFPGGPKQRPTLPWTHFIGGFCGLTVICVAAYSVPIIGAAEYTVALVLGMLVASVTVDTFGFFGQPPIALSPVRVLGLVLIAAGVALVTFTRGR